MDVTVRQGGSEQAQVVGAIGYVGRARKDGDVAVQTLEAGRYDLVADAAITDRAAETLDAGAGARAA